MHLLCLGLSHHTAPVDVRERFAISEIELGTTARALAQSAGLAEAVVVSTCNRVEFYAAAHDAPRGLTTLREFVERRAGTLGHDAFVHLTHAAGTARRRCMINDRRLVICAILSIAGHFAFARGLDYLPQR